MKTHKTLHYLGGFLAGITLASVIQAAQPSFDSSGPGEFSLGSTWEGGNAPGGDYSIFNIMHQVTLSNAANISLNVGSTGVNGSPRISGEGSLAITNGSINSATSRAFSITDNGLLSLGDGSSVANSANLNGSGGLYVFNGGNVEVKQGGNITLDANLVLGAAVNATRTSTFNMTGGYAKFNQILMSNVATKSRLEISGGTLAAGDNINIAAANGEAHMLISGNAKVNANATTAQRVYIGSANSTTASLTIKDNAEVYIGKTIHVGRQTGDISYSTANMEISDNASLTATDIHLGGWNAAGTGDDTKNTATARFSGNSITTLNGQLSLRYGTENLNNVRLTLADKAKITGVKELRVTAGSQLVFEVNDKDFDAQITMASGGTLSIVGSSTFYVDLTNFVATENGQFSALLIVGANRFYGNTLALIGADTNPYIIGDPTFQWLSRDPSADPATTPHDLQLSFQYAIPEPATYATMLTIGLVLATIYLRRRNRK